MLTEQEKNELREYIFKKHPFQTPEALSPLILAEYSAKTDEEIRTLLQKDRNDILMKLNEQKLEIERQILEILK